MNVPGTLTNGVVAQPFEVAASDGFVLSATKYVGPRFDGPQPNIVVAGATGIPQRFYARFGEYMASKGATVITFDYRGIGLSRPKKLGGFQANMVDWATLDLEAVLKVAPQAVIVGHSFGGQAFGLIDPALRTSGLIAFGTGAGWHGYMPIKEQIRVLTLWRVLGPLVTPVLGYLPGSYLGLGQDLPLGVYQQWRVWCASPRYFFADPTFGFTKRIQSVTNPIVSITATDDLWAPLPSARALFQGFAGTETSYVEVSPKEIGVTSIGHTGYFRVGANVLWDRSFVMAKEMATHGTTGRSTHQR